MNIRQMLAATAFVLPFADGAAQNAGETNSFIGKTMVVPAEDVLTPEALGALGRIGSFAVSPDGKNAVYSVTYYSVKQNKSHSVIYAMDMATRASRLLTSSVKSEMSPTFIKNGEKVAYLSSESGSSQLWEMNVDGSERRQLSFEADDVLDYLFSPDGSKVILVKEVPNHASIQANDEDLPLTSGMVCNDLMYKHWDHYTKSAPHPFVAEFDGKKVTVVCDVLEGEPYECPMLPFGGVEQLAWSPDGKSLAYTCRKKVGKDYAISTDSDIYLYDLQSRTTKNLCKPADFRITAAVDSTRSLEHQAPNCLEADCNMGYDQNAQCSPDGR